MKRTRSHLMQGTMFWVVSLTCALFASDPLTAQQGLGFEGSFGYQSVNGDYGEVLKGGVDAEFSVVWTQNRLRYGIGMDWASYHMEEPYEKESWSNVAAHAALSFFPMGHRRISPWIEIRAVGRRLRPEDGFLGGEEPDEEGENTSPRVFGMSGAGIAGVEIGLTQRSWLKIGGYLSTINTSNAELGDIDREPVDSGSILGFRVGLFWIP